MEIPVIPPKREIENRIQLELPDYSVEYHEWLRKKQQEQDNSKQDTVIIIDIY